MPLTSGMGTAALQDTHAPGSEKDVDWPSGQRTQLLLLPTDDTANPGGHAQICPMDTALLTPHGRHSYDVVSKYDAPHVTLDFSQYLVCPLTAPNREMTQRQTARVARIDQAILDYDS